MKWTTLIFVVIASVTAGNCNSATTGNNGSEPGDNIRLNQLGYFPDAVKKVVIINSASSMFRIVNTTGKEVFSGKLSDRGIWKASGEKVKIADFSNFTTPGVFRILVEDLGLSYPFKIGWEIYNDVYKASVKAYYLQRASTAIDEKYAGKFCHPLAHPDLNCIFHPSTGRNTGGMPSPKGWYDAGDYNKYIVNAGYTVSMLLTLYENFPDICPDNSNIPESGNNQSDLLDEIKYELDWAETMQDTDGGVFFKLTSKTFCGFVKPQDDSLPRYIVGKSTSSSLNFAAMFAQAARVWKKSDNNLAGRYLLEAKRAWEWAVSNPSVVFRNPSDIFTGEYGHSDFKGDFFWAAAELFATTGEEVYRRYIESDPVPFDFIPGGNWCNYLKNLGYYALILPESGVEQSIRDSYKKSILAEADKQLRNLEECPYLQPLNSFVWGSNSDILDLAVVFVQAFQLSREKKYLDAAIETTDYIFGKNAVGISFVTGFGSKSAMNPHFRLSASDDIAEPIPGWVVGGPNAGLNDELSGRVPSGVKYPSKEPAKCYVDQTASYASNEIAINWNAPLAFITGFLVSYSRANN
ncbi:MAG: glycoside hydrolase family 9 protein [Bacteroidales bacterium]